MQDNDNIFVNMPLSELLMYNEALSILSTMYEKNLLPLYGRNGMFNQTTPDNLRYNDAFNKAKSYQGRILDAIEKKVYLSLDNYQVSPEKHKAKMPETERELPRN